MLNMQVLTTLLVAQCGGCSVIMDRIDAHGVVEWIDRERVVLWNGAPATLHTLAHDDTIGADALASLDEVWTGGSDCPETIRDAFVAKFGLPVTPSYGLSEAPTVVSMDGRAGDHAETASGRPLPHLDVRIVDGEVCVAPATDGPWAGAYHLMLGYWDKPDATADTLRDGMLHT